MPENAPAAAARPLGPISRARASLEAIRTLLRLREDRGTPTADDLAALREWSGWGPLAPALSQSRSGSWAEIGEELQRLLPPRDYRQAEQGTSTAYYTPDVIVQECWTALRDLNFPGGGILEPGCGAGSFISQTPDGMPVQWYGVERDPTTAGIAALLHPDAEITNARLQDAGLQTNSVDAVLGNVPYGNFPVHDKTAPKAVTESIHNYFIWRSVQALRPGGVAILLTSRYTMDAVDEEGRRAIARHADLLGAVRLPTGALAEGGTKVVADLLVLRRRDTNGPMDTSWMESSEIPEVPGQFTNNYFLDHPEHVLGTFQEGRARQYGITLAVKPPEGQDLATALGTALDSITAAAREADRDWRVAVGAQPFTADALPFPVREDGRQEGSFHLVDGKPHEVVDGELVAVERAGKELPKLIALRDAAVKLIEAETNHDTPDVQLDPLRAEVNRLYDAYVQKHGPINRYTLAEGQVDEETGEKAISRRYPRLGGFRRDPDIVAVLALEDFDDETQTADKAPLLTRRVNRRIERPTSAQTPEEALSLCLNFKNKIDVPTIAQLLGIEEDQVPGALGELVFPNPDNGELLTRGSYLSGPVVDKLERAEFLLSQGRDDLQRHVDALREVQPVPLPPEDIKAKLGAPWIPVDDVKAFAEELLGVGVDILHVPRTATWSVDQPMTMPEAATSEWGTSRVNAFELLDLALNGQAPKVYDTFLNPEGGSRRVRNDKETMLAESKLMALTRRFASWVWEDPDRADRLAADYNRIFNAAVLPKHDGSHLTVDGIDPDFKPYTHQWDFVQRVLSAEEGALCPYPVGAGKTATMFMTAAKLKQLGLVSKPLIIVPNHLLEQIARDGKKLFPNARILMAGKKDLADARSRMLFAARCATGDWDTIVMTHNSFGRLGVHPVTEATYLEELANEYRIALSTLDTDDRKDRRIKEIAKSVDRFDARASDLRSKATDAGVTYENLGIDFLQVDEAHKFKNLALPATTEGMSLGKPSKRATDLDLKLILTRERTGRDNVTALYSGTFIDNSVREMYVFQHYAMPKRLDKLGLGSPDAWAANFIHFESRPEVGVDGVSFRLKRRPVEYTNADEALALFAEVAELRPPEEFKIERPRRVDRFVEIDATPNLVRYVGSISHRIDQIQTGKVKPFEDNMLNVITDGRKAALDLELVGMLPDGPGKAGAIVQNVLEIHERTKDLKLPGDPDDVSGGLQLIFCDLGTPSKKRGSQVYGKIRKGLVEGMPELGLPGIPRERIRFIHDYNSDLAKEQLFSDARAGKVSVLFMSSEKGGTGVNVQTRGVALHHADPPHKPAEWEQREGRLHRPGNRLIDLDRPVEFLRYVALNSFDSYMFQQLERKQRPIVQIMSGRKVGRVIQEIDPVGASFAQAKAVATGNPMLLELADVNGQLTVLLNEADGHRQSQARMQRKTEVLADAIREAEQTLPGTRAMADAITAAGDDDTWRTADGRVIGPDDVAGVLAQTAQASKPTLDLEAGYRWRGMSVGFTWHRGRQFGTVAYESYAHLVAGGHQVEVRLNLSWFGKGQSWRITKALSEAAEAAVNAPAEIERKTAKQRAALEDTRSHIGRPFDKHVELEAVRERKAALEDQISGAAVDSGRESGSGPQFDPGAAAGDDEMSLAGMAMHDATAMAGMLGGTAVVVSEGQIIGGARVIDRTDVDLRTPDLADLGQYQEALRALIEAAASDEGLTARARAAGADYGASDFRAAVAEWAQDWALERANRPEDRPAWLRDWLEPESADARQMLIGEAAWIVWEQARTTEPGQAPTVPQDIPTSEFDPEPVPAPEESAAPPAPPQPGPQEPAPATTPEAAPQEPVNGTASAPPAEAETPSGTDGQAPLQDLVDTFGERVMVGHIGVPQPTRAHQIAGWAIMVVLSDSQVRGLVSAIGTDRQPPRDSRHLPGELVREWIAEQQQAPTTAFYASSSVLPHAVRANGDVHLSTHTDGLTVKQGDITTTIRWEELPAWIDAAVAHDTSTRSAPWHYGSLDAEIHSRRFDLKRSRERAMKALDFALRWAPPPTDEQLAQARARYAPPAAPAATANPPAPEDAPAEKSTPQGTAQLPGNAAPVPGAEGYHYIEEGRTVRLYTEAGDEVGTAKWSHSKYRYLGDVQGDTVRGTEDGATVAKRMANHHAVVYGDRVHRPTADDQGRDPVWILHNGSDTLVFGVSPEDDTAKAALWTGGGFKQSRKVGGWYLPRTWKEPTRRQRVDDAVRVLAAAGRTVTVHTSRAERQEPPQRPARLPELVVTAPDLDEVPQLFTAKPFTAQDGLEDVQALETAYARWGRHPTVRAYLQQDSDARPDGFGTPDNPIAELHIAYHRARLALREPVPGGPQEIVRRVYGVAAWCQELEVVVDDDLLDPLQDVYKAAHLLAARSQATAALAAEQLLVNDAPDPGLADTEQQTPPKPDPEPSAVPGTSATEPSPATAGGEKAREAVPGNAEQVPAADGYYFTGDEDGPVHLYTADEGLVGTARWSSIQDCYVADVQGETFPGTGEAATTAQHMARYHAVVHGGDARRPDSESRKERVPGTAPAMEPPTRATSGNDPDPDFGDKPREQVFREAVDDLLAGGAEPEGDASGAGNVRESAPSPAADEETGALAMPEEPALAPPEAAGGEPAPDAMSKAMPEGASAVPGADGYRYVTERNASRTIYLYTDDEGLVGTARRAHARARYVTDVQGDTVPGTTQTLATVQLMAEYHAVVHGTQVHRPDGDTQGRDPVWIIHNASDTLVHGVEPDDRTALAALRATRFGEAHTIGAWHLPDLPTGTTRQDCVDSFVRIMAAAGRPVEVHTDRAARARTAAPDTLPELTVTAPNLDQVPQLDDAPPYADNADARQDIDRLAAAWQRWSEQPLVAAYHEQDRQARPDGKGPARNPVTELRLAHERAEQALENPGLAGRDEIVRRVYEVAAWCQALEPAVPDELHSPLRDLERSALVLTSRAQATAAAGSTAETGSVAEQDQSAERARGGEEAASHGEMQLGLFGDPAEGPAEPETAGSAAGPAGDRRGAQLQAALAEGEAIAPVSFTDQREPAAGWILTTEAGHTYRLRPVPHARPDEDHWEAGHDAAGSSWWTANLEDRPLEAALARLREDTATRTRFASLWAQYGHLTAQDPPFETTTDRVQLEEGVYLVRRFGRIGLIAECRWGWEHLTDPDGAQGRTGEDWSRKGPDTRQYVAEWKIWHEAQEAIPNARLRIRAQLTDDMTDTPDAYCDASQPYVGKCSAKRSGARYEVAVVTEQEVELGRHVVCAACLSHRLLDDEGRDVQSLAEALAKGDPTVGTLHWKQWPDRIAEVAGQLLTAALDAGETAPWPAQALADQIIAEACEAGDGRAAREARASARAAGGDAAAQKAAEEEAVAARQDRAALVARHGAALTETAAEPLDLPNPAPEGGTAVPEPAEKRPVAVDVNALTLSPRLDRGEPSPYAFTVTGPGLTVGKYEISHDAQGKGARGIIWQASWHGVEPSGRWDVISIGSGQGKSAALAAIAEHAVRAGGDMAAAFSVARRMYYDAGLWLLPDVGEAEEIQYRPDRTWAITAETGAPYTVRREWEGRTASGDLAPLLIEDQAGTTIASCTAVDSYMSAWAPMLERLRLHATAVADEVPHATAVTLGGPGQDWAEAWCVCSWTERADVAEYAGRAAAGEALALAHLQASEAVATGGEPLQAAAAVTPTLDDIAPAESTEAPAEQGPAVDDERETPLETAEPGSGRPAAEPKSRQLPFQEAVDDQATATRPVKDTAVPDTEETAGEPLKAEESPAAEGAAADPSESASRQVATSPKRPEQDTPQSPESEEPVSQTEAPAQPKSAAAPPVVEVEDPPEPRRYVDATPDPFDPAYTLNLYGQDGRGPDSAEVLHDGQVIATLTHSIGDQWSARLTPPSPQDVSPFGLVAVTARRAAVLYSSRTGVPYGPPPSAAEGASPEARGQVLRGELRDMAREHHRALTAAVDQVLVDARAAVAPAAVLGGLDRLAAAVAVGHDAGQMAANLAAVRESATSLREVIAAQGTIETRRAMEYPVAQLLYDATRAQARLQATVEVAQREVARSEKTRERPRERPREKPRETPRETPRPGQGADTREVVSGAAAARGRGERTGTPAGQPPRGDGAATDRRRDRVRTEGRDAGAGQVADRKQRPPAQRAAEANSAPGAPDTPRAGTDLRVEPKPQPTRPEAPEPAPPQARATAFEAAWKGVEEAWRGTVAPQGPPETVQARLAALRSCVAEAPAPLSPPSPARQAEGSWEQMMDAAAATPGVTDTPEWSGADKIRQALRDLLDALREAAGEAWERLRTRMSEGWRGLTATALEGVAGFAQRGADRLRGIGKDLPTAQALLDLGDTALRYSVPPPSDPPPAPRSAPKAAVPAPAPGPLEQLRQFTGADAPAPTVSASAARSRSAGRRPARAPQAQPSVSAPAPRQPVPEQRPARTR
ncbi:hypothetical protein OH749_31285 (plasmid) [Streptomyces albidoflavus]|uniref:DEAD/DEAH box helicase family protein n=1 Tax=Streptomyces albidoflavus TaxID=1886 RepID=UPI003872DEFA|nr:hypothetical protein OH749_31285 [Streptomyces albidoflavus]